MCLPSRCLGMGLYVTVRTHIDTIVCLHTDTLHAFVHNRISIDTSMYISVLSNNCEQNDGYRVLSSETLRRAVL
jgi:hypothetical protein